jgi:hypothetical protein
MGDPCLCREALRPQKVDRNDGGHDDESLDHLDVESETDKDHRDEQPGH